MKIGEYVFTHWTHNEGFEQRWLRRITRESKTHLFCDVQPTLVHNSNFDYKINKNWAKRFTYKNNNIIPSKTHLDNPDGIQKAKLVTDFSELICKEPYEKMFNIDLRDNIKDGKFFEHCKGVEKHLREKHTFNKKDDKKFWTIKTNLKYLDKNVEDHLKKLFNIKIVERFIGTFLIIDKLPTTHEINIYSKNVIFYHINFHWGKEILSFHENRSNVTIAFWLFKDRLVYQLESGIDTW